MIRKNDAVNCSGCSQKVPVKLLKNIGKKVLAGEPGFEPGLTESESAGLPLTYSPRPAGGVPPRRCGGLINKRTPDANTFCQKNAAGLCPSAFGLSSKVHRSLIDVRQPKGEGGRGRPLRYGFKKSLAKRSGAGTVAPTQNRESALSGRQASRGAMVETSERPRSRREAV